MITMAKKADCGEVTSMEFLKLSRNNGLVAACDRPTINIKHAVINTDLRKNREDKETGVKNLSLKSDSSIVCRLDDLQVSS